MGLFSSLKTYQGKWNVVSNKPVSQDDINAVESAEVVASQYGKSVCLHMKDGGMKFLPVSTEGRQPRVGETIDLEKCNIVQLHRDGDEDIFRLELK